MASVSHTAKPSSTSTGTLPAVLMPASFFLNSESWLKLSRSLISSNAMPVCFISTHGRNDQDE